MRPSHLETRYKFDLSPRQREVLELIERGRTNAEIAEELGITLDGAKYHVREILAKLGVDSREEAVAAWRGGQSRRRWRWIEGFAIGSGFAKGAAIAVAAIAAGGVAAVALVLALDGGDDGGDGPPAHAGSETPTAAVTATATPSAIRTEDVTLPACLDGDVTGELTAEPAGDDVRLALRLTGTASCEFADTIRIGTLFPPSDPSPPSPYFANLFREYNARIQFPFDGVVGEWLWGNYCGVAPGADAPGSPTNVPWIASQGDAGSRSGLAPTLFIDRDFPACVSDGAPTSLREATVSAALNPKYVGTTCDAPIAGWLCDFAKILETDLNAGDVRAAWRNSWIETQYTCGAGFLPGSEYTAICDGASEGEVRHGFPLTLHGSEGGPVTFAAMIARIESVIVPGGPSGTRPALTARSIGFATDGTALDTFIVAFSTIPQPSAVYMVFKLTPMNEPAFIGAGLSGDNASTILGGGTTLTDLGETEFVPLGMR